MMKSRDDDPRPMDPTAFAHDVARNGLRYDAKSRVRDYIERENPRGLPEKWIENYVERDRSLLALDVMRCFDRVVKAEGQRLWLKIVTVALIGSWSLIGYAIKLLIDHPHILDRLR